MGTPQMGYGTGFAPPTATSTASDAEGVGFLKIGSGLGVVLQALIWIGFAIFYLIFTALNSATNSLATTGSSTIPSWITVNTFYLAVGLIAGGLILGVVSFILFYLGFRAIRRADPSFGAPTTLMIIGLVGYLMIAIGIVVIVGAIVSAINAAAAGGISSGSAGVALSAILGGLGLIGLGGILGLVGVIGLVLGNWRAGSRYNETPAKIGAILSIPPFVSIVGYVLLLVGYVRAGSKIRSGWAPASRMPPMQPPAYYAPPGPPRLLSNGVSRPPNFGSGDPNPFLLLLGARHPVRGC